MYGDVEYKCCINGNDRLIKDRMFFRGICKGQNCQYLSKPDGFYMKVAARKILPAQICKSFHRRREMS